MTNDKVLVRFDQDFGRSGELNGLFICKWGELQDAMGCTAYFGEVLGKHSDVSCEINDDNCKVVTNDQDFINKLESFIGKDTISGWNPLSVLHGCRSQGEEEEDDDAA